MICGYQNIYDLCNNKFTYQYSSFTNNGRHVVVASGDLDSVIRKDTLTGQNFLLNSTDLINIDDCDNTQELETISAWNCYQIYRQNNNPIELPSLNDYKNAQKQYILDQYNNLLENGLVIIIDDFVIFTVITNNGSGSGSGSSENTTRPFTIRLPCKRSDQIYYGNLLAYLALWYASNSDNPIPLIIDYYNRSHELSYINLSKILREYFRKLKEYADIKDNLLDIIDAAETINDVCSAIFYTSRQPSGSSLGTTVS